MMSDVRIGLTLKSDGSGRTTVTWSDGFGQFPGYRLVTGLLKEKIERTRLSLEALSAAYPSPLPDHHPVLAELARHGHALRDALFSDCDGEDSAKADEARDWFESQPKEGVRVSVITDARLAIPWGALHEAGADVDTGSCYAGFWAPAFRVTAYHSGARMLSRLKTAGPAKLLAGKNEQIFSETLVLLDPEQRDRIERQFRKPVGCANTVAGISKMWATVGETDCIIYFFGHATPRELLFSNLPEGRLSVGGFRDVFKRDSQAMRRSPAALKVLTVLNGCLSGTGEDYESFLLATTLPGFYGVIGAEAKLPNTFGLLFGNELLEALLDGGMSVGDAMVTLRDRHKPYGLLYGCYAHPDLTASAHAA